MVVVVEAEEGAAGCCFPFAEEDEDEDEDELGVRWLVLG